MLILSFILIILSGILNAMHDALYHEKILDFSDYWNPYKSWTRKYKNRDKEQGEAFIGSTTVFVMFTDGIHLIKFFMYSFLIIGCSGLNFIQSFFGIGVFLVSFQLVYWLIEKLDNLLKP